MDRVRSASHRSVQPLLPTFVRHERIARHQEEDEPETSPAPGPWMWCKGVQRSWVTQFGRGVRERFCCRRDPLLIGPSSTPSRSRAANGNPTEDALRIRHAASRSIESNRIRDVCISIGPWSCEKLNQAEHHGALRVQSECRARGAETSHPDGPRSALPTTTDWPTDGCAEVAVQCASVRRTAATRSAPPFARGQ